MIDNCPLHVQEISSKREVKRCAVRLLKKVATLKYMKFFRKKEPDYTIKDIPLTPEDLSEGTYGDKKILNLYKKALLKKVAAIKAAQPPQQNNTERLPSPLKVLPPRYPTYEESKIKIEPIPLAKPGQGKLEHAVIRPGMVFQPVYQVQMFPPKSKGIAGQVPSQTPGVTTAPPTPAQTVPQPPQNTTSYAADLDRIGAVIDRELGRLRRFRQDWEKGHRFLHSGEGVTVNFEPGAEESFNSPYSDSFYYKPEGKRNAQSSGMAGMWSFPKLDESWYQPYPGPRPTVSGRTKALVFGNAEGISNAIKDLMAVINSILPLSSSTTYRTTPNIPRPT